MPNVSSDKIFNVLYYVWNCLLCFTIIITVCSYHFGKCYILLDDLVKTFGTFLTSWWFVQTSICKRFGWTLVSLHSKLEADFIGYNILKRSAHANNGYTYIGMYVTPGGIYVPILMNNTIIFLHLQSFVKLQLSQICHSPKKGIGLLTYIDEKT